MRDDYNLCEQCEAHMQGNYPYPMLKIRNPKKDPIRLICQYDYQPFGQYTANEEVNVPEEATQVPQPDFEMCEQEVDDFPAD